MFKKFRFLLVILGLAMVMIILLPSVSVLENINAKPNNAIAKNTGLRDITLNSTLANNMTSKISSNNDTNRYPISSPTKNSSILDTSQIANGTEMRQAINATGHARYTIEDFEQHF